MIMTDIITLDTAAGIFKEEKIDPLTLYDENLPMLRSKIPEYQESLPNVNMTNLIKRMKMTMKKFGGIGLSANQCGIFTRVFVIGTDQFTITCINPKIIESSEEMVKDNEGCLTYPGLYVKIKRPKWIIAEFTNENGELIQQKFEGLTARCFLHELDHMNGIRFVEHVGNVSIRLAKQRQEKYIKKMQRQYKNKNVTYA